MYSNKKEFNCSTCNHRHCDKNNPAPYEKWAVEGVLDEPAGVFRSNTCLLPMISDRTHQLIKLHKHYKNGFLINKGGISEQPALYLDAMELLDSRISDNVKK